MTKKQFDALQVKDRVWFGRQKATSTEVLSIDRAFGKLTVLLGRKPYSYRYVQQREISQERKGFVVGLY